jgi:hypothetical protein
LYRIEKLSRAAARLTGLPEGVFHPLEAWAGLFDKPTGLPNKSPNKRSFFKNLLFFEEP